MKIISIFNNKGGVGKTTLTYHLAHILAEMGKKVLMMDLDPQCNLSIHCLFEDKIDAIWEKEEVFITNFKKAKAELSQEDYQNLIQEPRSIHFLLSPTQQGLDDFETLPPVYVLRENLDLVVGRMTVSSYEGTIAEREKGALVNDPLATRTVLGIRKIALAYHEQNRYDYIIMDTSPSLGLLNKNIISMADGFFITCLPDLFSRYGIRNIGNSLEKWKLDFTLLRMLQEKNPDIPKSFVHFIGYTIYNAKKYSGVTPWNLAKGHFHHAKRIPRIIMDYIPESVRKNLGEEILKKPIGMDKDELESGEKVIIHSHETFPSFAQKYKVPMWELSSKSTLNSYLNSLKTDEKDKQIIEDDESTPEDEAKEAKNEYSANFARNTSKLEEIKVMYRTFAEDFMSRVSTLDK